MWAVDAEKGHGEKESHHHYGDTILYSSGAREKQPRRKGGPRSHCVRHERKKKMNINESKENDHLQNPVRQQSPFSAKASVPSHPASPVG